MASKRPRLFGAGQSDDFARIAPIPATLPSSAPIFLNELFLLVQGSRLKKPASIVLFWRKNGKDEEAG
jgi:hypothetical protein